MHRIAQFVDAPLGKSEAMCRRIRLQSPMHIIRNASKLNESHMVLDCTTLASLNSLRNEIPSSPDRLHALFPEIGIAFRLWGVVA